MYTEFETYSYVLLMFNKFSHNLTQTKTLIIISTKESFYWHCNRLASKYFALQRWVLQLVINIAFCSYYFFFIDILIYFFTSYSTITFSISKLFNFLHLTCYYIPKEHFDTQQQVTEHIGIVFCWCRLVIK